MPKRRPKFLLHERDRHGNWKWYVRKDHGPRIRLVAPYDTPAFWAEYFEACKRVTGEAVAAVDNRRTLRWAFDQYRQSSAWSGLSQTTRRQRENILLGVLENGGDTSLGRIDERAILEGRERRKDTPHQANSFLKLMRGFCAWCVEQKLMASNPAAIVKLLATENEDGFHTWSSGEMDRFEAYWPVGTRERLAYDLLLYTGLRRGDAVRVGPPHVRDGIITLDTEKRRKGKKPIQVVIPILPPLAESIAATPTGEETFLINERGERWVKESFGNWFGDACRKAKCPGSAHGLRKAGATRAAERGATERQLMAIYGWTTSKQATHYTRQADRARLSAEAMTLLLPVPGASPAAEQPEKSRTLPPVREKIRKRSRSQGVRNAMVPRGGIEPPTLRFSIACSTN